MKQHFYRHLVSVFVSFVGASGAYLLVAWDSLVPNGEMAWKTALVGAGFAGAREVVKLLVEMANHVWKPKAPVSL